MSDVQVLISEEQIAAKVANLAAEVRAVLPRDFVMVGVLTGAFVFAADLARALSRLGARPRIEFIGLKSYGDAKESSGVVEVSGPLPGLIEGETILLVEDVLDTGRTLRAACDLLAGKGAADVFTCVLIDKPSRHLVEVTPDFLGFTVGDRFIVGYGIDYAQQYRHLPYIGYVN